MVKRSLEAPGGILLKAAFFIVSETLQAALSKLLKGPILKVSCGGLDLSQERLMLADLLRA
jgi:hypothetical protein